jgi:IstB-like ATP binding protein
LKQFDEANIHLKNGLHLHELPNGLNHEIDRISKLRYFEDELSEYLKKKGGPNDSCNTQPPIFIGRGTVFEITPEGTLTTLKNFDNSDGCYPNGSMIQATNGNFYGTSVYGGGSGPCYGSYGTIFSITSGGTLTTVHSFDNTDGRYQRRSTILTSQLPVAYWHEQIGDPSIADSIMDRLVHKCLSHRIGRRVYAQAARAETGPGAAAMRLTRWEFKCAPGRFAAGCAFRLFVWVCRHAERNSGRPWLAVADLTQSPQKTGRQVDLCLHELVRAGVCRTPWSITRESPITTISYFSYGERLIDELNQGDIPPNYCRHMRDRTGQFERRWRSLKATSHPLSTRMEETE